MEAVTVELVLRVGLVLFAATLVASITGFGNALIAMPFLIVMLGLQTAAPLMAIAAFVSLGVIAGALRRSLDVGAVWRFVTASILTIPLGVLFVAHGPETIGRVVLGLVTMGYAAYRWRGRRLPTIVRPEWAFAFGGVGGLLAGAFNTGGPPAVVFADCRRWDPEMFRSNVAAVLFTNTIVVNVSHVAAGNITPFVLRAALWSLPFVAAGLGAGFALARRIDVQRFSRVVLVVLFLTGARMALSWWM